MVRSPTTVPFIFSLVPKQSLGTKENALEARWRVPPELLNGRTLEGKTELLFLPVVDEAKFA